MKGLVFGYRAFAAVLRCTATAETLRDLSDALDAQGPDGVHAVVSSHGSRVVVNEGPETRVAVDLSRLSVAVAKADCGVISRALRKLADGPDRARTSLADLGLLDQETSDADLEFFVSSEVPSLRRDYEPRAPGSTWEGVLYHPPPTEQQLVLARAAVLNWSVPTPDGLERRLFAVSEEGAVEIDLPTAPGRLLDPDDAIYQLNIYVEHPLVVPYGSPFTGALVWLTDESTEIILSEHCAGTGDFRVDIRNFFTYRRVLVALGNILDARKMAWGDVADGWPVGRRSPLAAFADPAAMWDHFTEILEPALDGAKIPRRIRREFLEAFHAHG